MAGNAGCHVGQCHSGWNQNHKRWCTGSKSSGIYATSKPYFDCLISQQENTSDSSNLLTSSSTHSMRPQPSKQPNKDYRASAPPNWQGTDYNIYVVSFWRKFTNHRDTYSGNPFGSPLLFHSYRTILFNAFLEHQSISQFVGFTLSMTATHTSSRLRAILFIFPQNEYFHNFVRQSHYEQSPFDYGK